MKTFKTSANRWIALGTLGAMTLGGVAVTTTPAQAGSKTWKKATIGAAAVTGYGLLKHKGKIATIGGVATAGSYVMYRKSKKKEESRRQAWYRERYGRNWREHYKAGS
jgi:hypothetical protein